MGFPCVLAPLSLHGTGPGGVNVVGEEHAPMMVVHAECMEMYCLGEKNSVVNYSQCKVYTLIWVV